MSAPSHLTCQAVVELVTDYLEHALPAEQAAMFEEHLNYCGDCEWYLEQMRATAAAVRHIEEEDVPPDARDQLMAMFRNWKRG
jgi:anti-sigma factor RsiW